MEVAFKLLKALQATAISVTFEQGVLFFIQPDTAFHYFSGRKLYGKLKRPIPVLELLQTKIQSYSLLTPCWPSLLDDCASGFRYCFLLEECSACKLL